MDKKIKKIFAESIQIKRGANLAPQIKETVGLIYHCYQSGNKVFVCGNGGSSEQAQHFATELLGKFKVKRRALAAIALGTNTSFLTAWSNDSAFKEIFARELEALGKEGDILIAISTSGNSENVIRAVRVAKKLKIKTVGFLGRGGKLQNIVDLSISVPSKNTPRIQEVHLIIIHIISELVEDLFYEKTPSNNQ